MQKNSLLKRDDSILRVLDERENEALVIDCVHPVMPTWIQKDELLGCTQIEESEIWPASNGISREDDIPVDAQRIMRERFTIITGVIPYIMDEGKRSKLIARAAAEHGVCRKTVRHYLCLYLAYQDVTVLAPKSGAVKKTLSRDEKNIRWALNKFYYTKNRNSLRTAYTLMLKERYCDEGGNLLPEYPSFHQFRYFYRKSKSLQDYYISREGIRQYQRNHRPLLGDGVQEYAFHVGVAMLDSTICDIYLVNEAGGVVGRPILTACIDAYSGLCCGYTLSWEGGNYSLRGLMLSVIEDKAAYCKQFGIAIEKYQWDCEGMLPGTLVTDKGSEYASQNFEQIAELGVTVVNLPAYRPELKGVVEKFFDLIQSAFKPHLKGKGVIEPDYQERGAHDYRKDACLTMEQFEKVVLNCILYYNSKRIIENYPYTDDMLVEGVQPYAAAIWNYGRKQPSADLIPVSREQLILTLLPRTTGRFSRSGLKVNQMRYRHDDYTESYLQGGEAVVAYNPDDVSYVWLIDHRTYVRFDLIEGRYAGKDLNGVQQAQENRKRLVRAAQEESLQARIDLADHIETIAGTAKKTGDTKLKNIRGNRSREQLRKHRDYMKGGMKDD